MPFLLLHLIRYRQMTFNPTKTLESENLLIREMLSTDFDELNLARSDPKIWQGHPKKDSYKKANIESWFEQAIQENALAIIDKSNTQLIGSSRYYEIDFKLNEVAIGYTFLTTKYWGGKTNHELKQLMLHHAWQYFETVWLHIGEENIRSRMAAEKIGANLDHTGHRDNIPYCWYIIPKGSI